jgi:hypothetical protein
VQRIRTIPNDSNLELQFLNRALSAMQTLEVGSIPPQDAFPMSEFDIVIHRNVRLGRGGFGDVFAGNWHGTNVAIKRIYNAMVSRTTSMDFSWLLLIRVCS